MLTILIVDDEREILEDLYEKIDAFFEGELKVLSTYLSREAKEIINTQIIDILLTDINMPNINGFELAKLAKKENENTKIVFLTGYDQFDFAYKALKVHCDDFIRKIHSDEELIKVISRVMGELKEENEKKQMIDQAQKYQNYFEPIESKKENPIEHIKKYIWDNIANEISLRQLAEIVYLNPSYLSRIFKKETNVTLSDYILKTRIHIAKKYLTETNLKIQEVAQKVGIDSATYFGRVFKREVKMTPIEYRNMNYH